MKHLIPEIVIMSAFKSNLPKSLNDIRHDTLKMILTDLGLNYKVVEGGI